MLDRSGNCGIADLRALIADGPQHRLHKGAERSMKDASEFNPSRGPGGGLHRVFKPMASAQVGQPRTRQRSDPMRGLTKHVDSRSWEIENQEMCADLGMARGRRFVIEA
jgi:hypothetical protein